MTESSVFAHSVAVKTMYYIITIHAHAIGWAVARSVCYYLDYMTRIMVLPICKPIPSERGGFSWCTLNRQHHSTTTETSIIGCTLYGSFLAIGSAIIVSFHSDQSESRRYTVYFISDRPLNAVNTIQCFPPICLCLLYWSTPKKLPDSTWHSGRIGKIARDHTTLLF